MAWPVIGQAKDNLLRTTLHNEIVQTYLFSYVYDLTFKSYNKKMSLYFIFVKNCKMVYSM